MKIKSLERASWFTVLSFLLPGFTGFLLFVFIPMISTIGVAFTNYSGGPNWKFIGIRNFRYLMESSQFHQSLLVTLQFVFFTVIFQILLGLLFAVLLNQGFRGTTFFRSLFFMPNVLSAVGVSLAFSLIFHPGAGFANQLLASLGLPPNTWLTSSDTALMSIIIVTLWMSFGYYMVIFLGGLQSISPSLYEAASIDGANGFHTFFKVTLPMLSPTMFFAMTMSIIGSFKVFDQVFMMTGGQAGGGPAGSTNVVVFDVYLNSFTNYKFGYASAESLILLVIILAITLIQFQNQKKWVTYDL
ncbi:MULTISPECIES: carbohydrate ABC transporter permease [unclassified Oceanispirochaeta]|uniref:carbohydrate ABC transporter permease n=1 Tax=unclassified Oceanispirochaeta TaxID=2635722 RepID=UPI000E09C8CD|nr:MULTISPECIES: sugar ABC transporter permease [unclassified Oceanispirochaeta]MBF9016798.1 sugar ABC transporter permease [Oceanispirochaeta sp. M2]NPD72068.1 sugar ABC transporter permease [Oceanispirochaeta sp. M1]RDG32511.1 sugar ABC transporter permease [Oceanispirochaeta sp. M1]